MRLKSASRARTRNWLGKSPPTFGVSTLRSRTRAKVFVTPASRSGARKVRPFNNMATFNRKAARERLHRRIRKKVSGTAERPRLAIHFSGQHIYAQVIDDDAGKTLAAVSTLQKDLAGKKVAANRESAERVGKAIAEKLLAKKVDNVVFDRGGHIFHGKVKALADAAREGG